MTPTRILLDLLRAAFIGFALLFAVVAAFGPMLMLTGCGGNDAPAPQHWLLIMETTAHRSETIFVYDADSDCIAAGSYRVFSQPAKYVGYVCKEV